MKMIFICACGCLFSLTSCRKHTNINTIPPKANQIIANHSIIDDFEKIPAFYLGEVKKMLVFFPGESHSLAYRTGMTLLQSEYPDYVCKISSNEEYTDQYLRVNQDSDIGEAQWFTWYAYPLNSRPSSSNIIKNIIKDYSDRGNPIHAIGFAWCTDLVGHSRMGLWRDRLAGRVSFKADPIYGVHWRGFSDGGPDGDHVWGLDSTDYAETSNRVSADTYLNATEDYNTFCKANGYITRVIFTTGPADLFTGEAGYQGFLKHQYIRNFVKQDSSRILFDYNDILCHDDNGSVTTTTWKGHTYPIITPSNLGDAKLAHIGSKGAIRLAKAQWWMLARIAGWDGK